MFSQFFEQHLGLSPYSRLDQDGLIEEPLEKDVIRHIPSSRKARYCYLLTSAILGAAAGATGYFFGTLKGHGPWDDGRPSGVATQGENI